MRKSSIATSKQSGAAILMILFTTIIVALFSVRLMSMNVQATHANTFETMSTRAYWAARSVLESAVYQYVPLEGEPTQVCPAVSAANAFPQCTFVLGCEANGEATIINVVATCADDSYRVSRRMEVEVRSAAIN
ncbi:MSHA biogenesis protein MshP [Vibrio sp. T187]|uniref:MSHA biogenesis protein MshP n=1 Tax=Vibrio TaxID=662 RepID=UPI0010C942B6|nr:MULTISPECIES: MSHA biogenesis protein MshP [Vibrio]MBW3696515.1 MSHA biogenesis protein MshP [Vibrio sp. T187]